LKGSGGEQDIHGKILEKPEREGKKNHPAKFAGVIGKIEPQV
jgi:hypothetical protein